MLRKFVSLIVMSAVILCSFTGCWDKVEIEQRGFVGVMTVDMAPPGYAEKIAELDKAIPGAEKQDKKMIKVTYAFPIASALAGEGGGGGGNEPGFTTISSISTSVDRTSRNVDSRISRRMFLGFTQVVVFSEEFLNNPDKVKEVIDYLRRDPEFSRSMRVLYTEHDASKVTEIKPKSEKLLFRYIRGILMNEASNGRIIEVRFNDMVKSLEGCERVAVIPKATASKDEIKISGIGLIKNYKFAGQLSEIDSQYFNTLSGQREGGTESISADNGLDMDFAIRNMSRRLRLMNEDPSNLEIGIDVRIEGSILAGEADKELYDSELLRRIEKELSSMMEERCRMVIKKLQKEYNVDALLINDYLKKFHPSTWDSVKDKWDDVYPGIKITPVIQVSVRRIGTVK